MSRIPEDVPHIQACCSNCSFIFDMKFGTDCPKCNGMGVKWARLMSEREYMRSMYGERGADIRDWNSPTLTAGEQKDVAELDKIFALEDKR